MQTTIAAIATAQAPGGIGVIRISGPQAAEIAARVFHSRRGVFGTYRDTQRYLAGSRIKTVTKRTKPLHCGFGLLIALPGKT